MRRYRTPSESVRSGKPTVRTMFSCTETCHYGTEDPREFDAHVAACPFVRTEVSSLVAREIKAGLRVSAPPRIPTDAPGQMEIPGTPNPVRRKRR